MIDKLQKYYEIAVRSNVGDLAKMAIAIHASLSIVLPVTQTLVKFSIAHLEVIAGVGTNKTKPMEKII